MDFSCGVKPELHFPNAIFGVFVFPHFISAPCLALWALLADFDQLYFWNCSDPAFATVLDLFAFCLLLVSTQIVLTLIFV